MPRVRSTKASFFPVFCLLPPACGHARPRAFSYKREYAVAATPVSFCARRSAASVYRLSGFFYFPVLTIVVRGTAPLAPLAPYPRSGLGYPPSPLP